MTRKFEGFKQLQTAYNHYDSVLHVSNTLSYNFEPGKVPVNMYFAKNIGLVKIAYSNGEAWELKDYKIIK